VVERRLAVDRPPDEGPASDTVIHHVSLAVGQDRLDRLLGSGRCVWRIPRPVLKALVMSTRFEVQHPFPDAKGSISAVMTAIGVEIAQWEHGRQSSHHTRARIGELVEIGRTLILAESLRAPRKKRPGQA